jgi:exosortase A
MRDSLGSSATLISSDRPVATGWQITGFVILGAVLCVLGMFWSTIASLIEIWKSSRTFAHGFLVLPAACYLAWCYRQRWLPLTPVPSLWGVGAIMLTGTSWFLGYLANLIVLQQAAVVASLASLVWALLGSRIARVLSWPLGFLIFLLPIGTSIEPWLQNLTASFILFGLRVTDVPYLYDNHRITLSSGTWEVAPDCGGLRYLLPGLALGYAFGTLIYRHPARRLVFLAFCAAMLVVANGIRAYGVIMADHLGIAEGTDHRLFSYTIYSITIPLLYWLGVKWADTNMEAPIREPSLGPHGHDVRRTILVAAASVALLAAAPLSAWLWMGRP